MTTTDERPRRSQPNRPPSAPASSPGSTSARAHGKFAVLIGRRPQVSGCEWRMVAELLNGFCSP
jgi:hypothetical protein